MRKMLSYMVCMLTFLLCGCDVHEFPDPHYFPDSSDTPGNTGKPNDSGNTEDPGNQDEPQPARLLVRLDYETEMTEWEHEYDGTTVIEHGLGETYDNFYDHGKMRYVVRACPVSSERVISTRADREYEFIQEVVDGYDAEFWVDVPAGTYNIMVWSDFLRESEIIYEVGDFSGIMLEEVSSIGDDSGDAFRGTNEIFLSADLGEGQKDTIDITMQRPLAKFEFVANDLPEFVVKAAERLAATKGDTEVAIDISDYKVRFYYVGFKPDVYSMYSDKPVDSSLGVTFESTMSQLSSSEAKIGFDYVFVGDQSTAVTLQVGVYDEQDTQISLTKPISVPLMRRRHTVMTGAFLTPNASSGVVVDPEYDGDHNLIIP